MMRSIGRCRVFLRHGGCGRSVTPLISRQCLSKTTAWYSSKASTSSKGAAKKEELLGLWDKYSSAHLPAESETDNIFIGFLGKRRNVSKHLSFADIETSSGELLQICSNSENDPEAHLQFRDIPAFSPVRIRAHEQPPASGNEDGSKQDLDAKSSKRTVHLAEIQTLNSIDKGLIVTPEVQFPPTKRHLQLRFHPELKARLQFRSWLKGMLNQSLVEKGFTDVETPTLFKSTPEGAREFLVPTRQPGTAYALSQSPQQYKQVLMASGFMRYMQWARCYRDEDARTDRQPEFSQLDMEWAFAGAKQVKKDVNDIMLQALAALRPSHSYQEIRGERIPMMAEVPDTRATETEPVAHEITSITFADSISAYGIDKPDLRIPMRIHAIEDIEPFSSFAGMITHLPEPMVETFTFPLDNCSPTEAREFVVKFMDSLPPALVENPDGKPQILIHDSSKPMNGFSSVGFEFESVLDLASGGKEIKDGDLVVFQAREKTKGQYCAGSTKIGELRGLLWRALVKEGYMSKPRLGDPGSLQFAWVTEFPMFKPNEEGEPGQGGSASFSASHHPFTAPLTTHDLELLFTDPLQAKSASYDLVLNGVEVGGGSERNHIADVQEFIMRDVLKMDDARIKDFAHLFEALRAGCPPHAGFALGVDRLVALMTDTTTVRDVIAFPKTMKGEDAFVKSPSKISDAQLAPYGLQLKRRAK